MARISIDDVDAVAGRAVGAVNFGFRPSAGGAIRDEWCGDDDRARTGGVSQSGGHDRRPVEVVTTRIVCAIFAK